MLSAPEFLGTLLESRLPVISAGIPLGFEDKVGYATADDEGGARAMVEFLLRRGCQRIVHIAGPRYWTTAAPVVALLALLVLRPSPVPEAAGGTRRLTGVLRAAEVAVAVFVVLVMGTLVVLAL